VVLTLSKLVFTTNKASSLMFCHHCMLQQPRITSGWNLSALLTCGCQIMLECTLYGLIIQTSFRPATSCLSSQPFAKLHAVVLSRLVLIMLLAASQMLHEALKQEHGRFRQSSWACLVKGHLRGSQRHQIRTAAGQMRALTSVPITQGKGI